mmetsp:Transcript_47498/g.146290  ORF Transcript_47498/g.146290 Transcript_47498/m.146290 type:complete len:495 (-) Transcript_47498:143-1627(-)|eukprot:CAMPEP_0204513288 /NCGR_PEP_ID=MMETSP0661-20131031/1426_1 /ASSEMBLY_ACC=CAM_ASM_000606 /TAXON_ID=109239 /ORGANISM="Alexandrium margalefi, Strain AMGDE01CS-322" /LENGTH=494 /DNA_ID=CAMNT_0051518459 /DNA_START=25 /DNA_END=1509 /DNA_ORIENTATION=+
MTDTRLYSTFPAAARPLPDESSSRPAAQVLAPYVAEFLGTFVVVFTVGSCVLAPGNPVWNPTSIGCVLMVMVYVMGSISGGNLNPAVSVALALVGALRWSTAVAYSLVQLLGGLAAGFCCRALFAPRAVQVEPGPGFTRGYAMIAETIYTFMLCFVVCNCIVSKRSNPKDDRSQFYAPAVGFAVVSAGYAVGSVSGACVNPAVAIGLDVSAVGQATGLGWTWAFAELLGALLAAALYRLLRPEDLPPEAEPRAPPEADLGTKCLCELLGSFMLVFTVGMNLISASPAHAWSAAAALTCMVYSVGNVSGGHFNPAVTLAVILGGRNKCSAREGLAYVCAQLVGGILAGLAYACFHAKGWHRSLTYGLRPGIGYGRQSASVAEMFFTFVLAYVVLSSAAIARAEPLKTKQHAYFAVVVGACFAGCGFSVGAVSGGHFNPTICLGISSANFAHWGSEGPDPPWNCALFSSSELLGGVLAAAVFRHMHPKESEAALPS